VEITTTKENLLEKLVAQMTNNVIAGLASQELSEEEVNATLVLNKKKIANDANVITELVFKSLSEQPAE
jgi:hypothetical protein